MRTPRLEDEVSFHRISYRVLFDVYHHASAAQWRRRALQLEAARPRAGDFHGQASRHELRAQWDRLTEAADACRTRAAWIDAATAEFDNALADLAADEAIARTTAGLAA